jgi:hypothetical protein
MICTFCALEVQVAVCVQMVPCRRSSRSLAQRFRSRYEAMMLRMITSSDVWPSEIHLHQPHHIMVLLKPVPKFRTLHVKLCPRTPWRDFL